MVEHPPVRPERSAPELPSSIPARKLFAGRKEITIEHRGVTYRLRITRNDKLILTK